MTTADSSTKSPLAFAADLVCAFVSHNSLPASEVADLIGSVHASFAKLSVENPQGAIGPSTDSLIPAVSVRKSVTADYLICLDDGKKFKSLGRHLASLGMTPEQYRTKWSLPRDYPMVAANYTATRSALAKEIGFGRKSGQKRKQIGSK